MIEDLFVSSLTLCCGLRDLPAGSTFKGEKISGLPLFEGYRYYGQRGPYEGARFPVLCVEDDLQPSVPRVRLFGKFVIAHRPDDEVVSREFVVHKDPMFLTTERSPNRVSQLTCGPSHQLSNDRFKLSEAKFQINTTVRMSLLLEPEPEFEERVVNQLSRPGMCVITDGEFFAYKRVSDLGYKVAYAFLNPNTSHVCYIMTNVPQ